MSAKRRLLIACTLITAIYHFPAYSSLEYKGTFGSINAGYADWNSGFVNTHRDRKSTRLNSIHRSLSRMPSSA